MANKQMTLGQLIDVLERKDPAAHVDYLFGYFSPTFFHSWRGAYEQLALGYAHWNDIGYERRPTVKTLLDLALKADGETFTGYKGGDFTMSRDNRLWISRPEEACHSGIVDVIEDGQNLLIVPGLCRYL